MSATANETSQANDKLLFWASFVAIMTTAFGFIIRALILDELKTDFDWTETQKGEIFGVGLYPFSISIILFSLVIDRIGYKTAMYFAFACHTLSAIVTIFAPQMFNPYWAIYLGTFIVALGNGTVEAVANPVVATLFPKEKTKWLNILHAGWPGGLVLGGIITIMLDTDGLIADMFNAGKAMPWEVKVALLLLPTLAYGVMMLFCTFPVSERVAAGVSDRDMMKEFGIGGALIAGFLIYSELARVAGAFVGADYATTVEIIKWIALAATVIGFGAYVGFAIGRPLFLFMLLIMIPLATTELGTDSWITSLMEPQMKAEGFHPGWVLIYTSTIMMILRFFAGSIVHRISPLGLLAASSVIAIIGLLFLSRSDGLFMIFAAATIYGFGKSFFWPTMLGVVAEQSPKGGALTLNACGGVGMLGVGVVGAVFLGYIQDTTTDQTIAKEMPTIHEQVITKKEWAFGTVEALDPEKVSKLPEAEQKEVEIVVNQSKKSALATVAIFPGIMLACYVILILYFMSKGGYQAEVLTGHEADDEKFTGGVEGPVE